MRYVPRDECGTLAELLATHATSLLFNGESFLFATSHAVPSSTVETGVFEMDLSIVFDVSVESPI